MSTVELGPSPSGLKTWTDTRYCVKVSRLVISWLCENEKLTVKLLTFIICAYKTFCRLCNNDSERERKQAHTMSIVDAMALRWVIIQINYVTYLHTTISDINLFNVFTLLFVAWTISDAIPKKFAMNRARWWRLPRDPHGARRCVVRWCEIKMKWNVKTKRENSIDLVLSLICRWTWEARAITNGN